MELKISDNQLICYELIEGDSDKPYLIFLHEGLGCIEMWKDFPEQLCKKTKCPGLVYDRLGYGKSSSFDKNRSIHYVHEYAFYELPKVIEAVIPNRQYILVGHSDGASIGLIHGAARPVLLQGMILAAAHVLVEPETIKGIQVADRKYDQAGARGLTKYHGEKTHEVFKAWTETWLSEWFKHWNIEYLLPSILCPLLVVQGSEDEFGTEYQINTITAQTSGPAKSCILPKCGHAPHLEQPELLLGLMSEFIKKVISQ